MKRLQTGWRENGGTTYGDELQKAFDAAHREFAIVMAAAWIPAILLCIYDALCSTH